MTPLIIQPMKTTIHTRSNKAVAANALSVAASGLAQGEFQSVMRFDLAAARTFFDTQLGAGQWNIQSVALSLTAAPGSTFFNASAAGLFDICWMQNDSWIEGTGKPTVPTTIGITYAGLPSYTSNGSRPLLSVVATPEPQAFSLLLAGAIFICRAEGRRGSQPG